MANETAATLRRREQARTVAGLARAASFVFLAWAFFAYPAWVTVRAVFSGQIQQTAQSPTLHDDFRATAGRYRGWAKHYLQRRTAAGVQESDVAATEWPMFGSVFFLLTAEELARTQPQLLQDKTVREAVELAARVVSSPDTATWVRLKWGSSYLERENVFYRMLLILGLSSHQGLTGQTEHAALLRQQSQTLTAELLAAPLYLADDYPDECYPSDVVWAVAALKRAASLGYVDPGAVDQLAAGLLTTLNGPAMTGSGLPSFRVLKGSGKPLQLARGSGNSGIIPLTAELDTGVAATWFDAYVRNYWKAGWVSGFREMPHGMPDYEDVDAGPTLFGVGSVATGFGLGAARSVGRYDYAVPLAMQTVPAAWPTPFGLLLPGLLGWSAADGWCFGELALEFSMTRPDLSAHRTEYTGGVPRMVWVFLGFYVSCAGLLLWAASAVGQRAVARGRQAFARAEGA